MAEQELLDGALDEAVAALPCPALPAALAERVARLARAHLAPPEHVPAARLPRLREALVPALLMSAAVVRTADTVEVVRQVFGPAANEPDDGADER